MTTLALLHQLHALGVILTPSPDGSIHCRAPKGVLTQDLVDKMRAHKAEVHALVEAFEERAGLIEFDGGLECQAAEALAWQCVLGEMPAQAPQTPLPAMEETTHGYRASMPDGHRAGQASPASPG